MKKKINEEKLIELYQNHSQYELAKIFDCSIATIYHWAEKLNLLNERTTKIKYINKNNFINIYKSVSRKEVAKYFGITVATVTRTAKLYGCYQNKQKITKRLSSEELEKFIKIAPKTITSKLMEIFNKDKSTICRLRKRYNCEINDFIVIESSLKINNQKYILNKLKTDENIDFFKKYFPIRGNNYLMDLFGISEKAIYILADKLNCKRADNFRTTYSLYDKQGSDKISQVYFNISNWKKAMFNLVKDELQKGRLKNLGVYHNVRNKTGLMRDHIYSRYDGFINNIFPELIRHPANCQLLTLKENSIKGMDSHITLEDLFNKIEKFDLPWYEQEVCISLIQKYRAGERWTFSDGTRYDEYNKSKYSTRIKNDKLR